MTAFWVVWSNSGYRVLCEPHANLFEDEGIVRKVIPATEPPLECEECTMTLLEEEQA
jgi:hypothetical protein